MSLCYDFSKWTMITLASIAISLTIGLVLIQYAHGQVLTPEEQQQYAEDIASCYVLGFPLKDLVILTTECGSTGSFAAFMSAIKTVLEQGYTVKAADNGLVFMEKIK